MTSSSLATSRTDRAIGAICACGRGYPSHMPLRLTRPGVGRKPTTPFQPPGRRTDANVSSPMVTVEKFAAREAPEPPEEPPAVLSKSYGLRVTPNMDPYVSPLANSLIVALPRMIAPAF